jgi:hypothetical protein
MDWDAVTICVLQDLHLETQNLLVEAIHTVTQLSMALLHGLFIGLESCNTLSLSRAKSDGGLAVSLLNWPWVFVL